jgi:hypothetical protein
LLLGSLPRIARKMVDFTNVAQVGMSNIFLKYVHACNYHVHVIKQSDTFSAQILEPES